MPAIEAPADRGAVGLRRIGPPDDVMDRETGRRKRRAQLHPAKIGEVPGPAADGAGVLDPHRAIVFGPDDGEVLVHDPGQDVGETLAPFVVVAARSDSRPARPSAGVNGRLAFSGPPSRRIWSRANRFGFMPSCFTMPGIVADQPFVIDRRRSWRHSRRWRGSRSACRWACRTRRDRDACRSSPADATTGIRHPRCRDQITSSARSCRSGNSARVARVPSITA